MRAHRRSRQRCWLDATSCTADPVYSNEKWIWRGTKEDGTPLEERGVTIMGIRDGQIAWGRLYLEETEREGADITETVRRMAGRDEL
jgi:ketosteroid isomerase-like protein